MHRATAVDAAEVLHEEGLALHDAQTAGRSDVAVAEHPGGVGDHRYQVAPVAEVERGVVVVADGGGDHGNAGRVVHVEPVEAVDAGFRHGDDLAPVETVDGRGEFFEEDGLSLGPLLGGEVVGEVRAEVGKAEIRCFHDPAPGACSRSTCCRNIITPLLRRPVDSPVDRRLVRFPNGTHANTRLHRNRPWPRAGVRSSSRSPASSASPMGGERRLPLGLPPLGSDPTTLRGPVSPHPGGPRPSGAEPRLVGPGVFIVATCTDFIDGAMASTRDQITVLGTYIDPLADKLLVAAVLAFVGYEYGIVLAWVMVGFIAVELVLTAVDAQILLRRRSARPANTFGKAKMILQSVALYLFLLGGILEFDSWMQIGCDLALAGARSSRNLGQQAGSRRLDGDQAAAASERDGSPRRQLDLAGGPSGPPPFSPSPPAQTGTARAAPAVRRPPARPSRRSTPPLWGRAVRAEAWRRNR